MSSPTNFSMMPSACSALLHESGPSSTTARWAGDPLSNAVQSVRVGARRFAPRLTPLPHVAPDRTPSSFARSKMKRLLEYPAVTNTTTAPRSTCRRSLRPSALRLVTRSSGNEPSRLSVGESGVEATIFSRSGTDSPLGSEPMTASDKKLRAANSSFCSVPGRVVVGACGAAVRPCAWRPRPPRACLGAGVHFLGGPEAVRVELIVGLGQGGGGTRCPRQPCRPPQPNPPPTTAWRSLPALRTV